MRSYSPVVKGHQGQIKKAVQMLLQAERPMIYSGGGVILSDGVNVFATSTIAGNGTVVLLATNGGINVSSTYAS
jgi:thiamine pyrophosphate-dependent acetolactate synthase large subunit-like protein